jgi:GDP-L-fucose synthase
MVGAALVRRLKAEDCSILSASRDELDLSRQQAVEEWVSRQQPDAIFMTAARVGGILANDSRPAEFLRDNLVIETNIIEAARQAGVKKLLFLGSSCIYPRLAAQPMQEDALMTGPLEPTNEWYAIAKIAGLKLAAAYRRQYGCDFISAMPTNLYGPGDNFDLASSHVLPALLRKAHEAKTQKLKEMTIWGSGAPVREFLHVDDCADALVFLMKHYSDEGHINIGTGKGISVLDLARLVARIVGFDGGLRTDSSKPDGTPRKVLDISRMSKLGWAPRIDLTDGIASTYRRYLELQAVGQSGP